MKTFRQQAVATDYQRRGRPQHNARIFMAVWHQANQGINEHGLVALEGGVNLDLLDFRDVVTAIQQTDTLRRLTKADAENAAAMVYHLSPKCWID